MQQEKMKEIVYNGKPIRVDRFLAKTFGYNAAQKILRRRDVKVNGARVKDDFVLCDGDALIVYAAERDALAGRILYEDAAVIVLDKPRALDTYEASELLRRRYDTVIPVHRLDRNTDGVMIFARNEDAQTELEKCFLLGKTQKIYHAEVVGRPKPSHAFLTAYLKKDAETAVVRISDVPKNGYLTIQTEYRVLGERPETTILEIVLHTGRTHQIRAHLAHIGYPILGDGKYGDYDFNRRYGKKYQCLTCVSLNIQLAGALAYLSDFKFEIGRATDFE